MAITHTRLSARPRRHAQPQNQLREGLGPQLLTPRRQRLSMLDGSSSQPRRPSLSLSVTLYVQLRLSKKKSQGEEEKIAPKVKEKRFQVQSFPSRHELGKRKQSSTNNRLKLTENAGSESVVKYIRNIDSRKCAKLNVHNIQGSPIAVLRDQRQRELGRGACMQAARTSSGRKTERNENEKLEEKKLLNI